MIKIKQKGRNLRRSFRSFVAPRLEGVVKNVGIKPKKKIAKPKDNKKNSNKKK